ncbi:MAG: hypothetical protein NZ551_01670 [Microscillaceae bacterium]|nr:hypothetical protein [Microscillaceae bacterium]MDW8459896.1 hypothetical protein [Cytophagales bacterium]
MKIKFSFIIFFTAVSLPSGRAWSQYFAEREWQNGSVFLEEDTLIGNFKYELERETVIFESGGQLQTFSSRKVVGFQFYDNYYRKNRFFYTLPFAKRSNYKTPTFFELLYQGETVSLLCREQLTSRTQSVLTPNPWGIGVPNTIITYSIKYDFYFLFNKNNQVKYFNSTKKDLLRLLPDQASALQNYLEKNKVRFNSPEDMTNLIAFYNSLKK